MLYQLIELVGAYDAGHHIGEFINDHIVQPILDHYQVGSGPVGEEYLHFVNNHFDPIHPLESYHPAQDHHDDVQYSNHDDHIQHDNNDHSNFDPYQD